MSERAVDREVYDIEVNARTGYTINGELTHTDVEWSDTMWRVDEIRNGMVHVSGFHENPEASSLLSFDPDAARDLAAALDKAADYAERQESDK